MEDWDEVPDNDYEDNLNAFDEIDYEENCNEVTDYEENEYANADYDENLNALQDAQDEDHSNADALAEEQYDAWQDAQDSAYADALAAEQYDAWLDSQDVDDSKAWQEDQYEENYDAFEDTDYEYEETFIPDSDYEIDFSGPKISRPPAISNKLSMQTAAATIVRDDIVPSEIKLMSDKTSVPLYLKLLESGSEIKRDIRLVIVGEKGVGKTSLLKRLFGEEMGGVTSTNGIEIHRIKCHAEYNDGIWKKLEGKSEESELHTRLLKPFEKILKRQVQVNSKASTEGAAFKVSKDNKPTSSHATKKMTFNDSTFPSLDKLQLTKATAYHEKQPEHSSQQAHKDVERVLTSSLDKFKRTQAIVSHEKLPEHPLEQAHKEIEKMLRSKVDLHDKEEYATLLLWDFAGDEEFYHTHQTFLSADAIYLVVTKLNEADNKGAQGMFRLWMDSIHCYCRSERQNTTSGSNTNEVNELTDHRLDPPVILIGTCTDQIEIADGEEVQNACMERLCEYTAEVSLDACRHIVEEGKYCISNTKDDTTVFQKIREYISKLARTMKSWNRSYPLKFINLEKLLQEKRLQSPIISYKQIQNICTAISNPLNDEELNLFLRFHHEIRALIYFEDLPDYIILDTQWLSDAFKCIVTAEKFHRKVRSFRNKDKWEDLNQRGMLHSEVLEDIFKKQETILCQHKDHILNVMEKFDILIRPITAVEEDFTPQNPSYYVPCMVKEKPECDIYEMFNVTEDTCKKSTWFCLKFSFLPPHLMHHLIASLCREYEVSKVFDPIQNKKVTALFRGTAVFDLQKTRLQKLLVSVLPNLIQIQVLEFRTNAVIKRGSFLHIADFVEGEISKIISTRFKMTNVTFEKKWECGSVKPEFVTGSNDFMEEHDTEYFCETCTASHKLIDEWSKQQVSVIDLLK